MTIGERIYYCRTENHMTQKQLAEKCGMADSAIRKYESGKITPKFETAKKLAAALDIDVNWLLSGSTLEEHNEAFINRISGKGNTSARDLYLQKHPNDEPAKTPKRNLDLQKLAEELDSDGLKMLETYAEFLINRQKSNTLQNAPGGADDKEPTEK